jgi:CDGSH-type Zn-finger protein
MSVKIKINNNGSIRVEGEFTIVDANDQPYNLNGRTTIGLCRCGHSKNKPFCDGSHRGTFEHESVAFELPPPAPKV